MPETEFFEFSSIEKVQKFLKHHQKSEYAECIMAQSLQRNSTAFCICIYGSDNRFKAEDVYKRWNYISETLKSKGVEVFGEFN